MLCAVWWCGGVVWSTEVMCWGHEEGMWGPKRGYEVIRWLRPLMCWWEDVRIRGSGGLDLCRDMRRDGDPLYAIYHTHPYCRYIPISPYPISYGQDPSFMRTPYPEIWRWSDSWLCYCKRARARAKGEFSDPQILRTPGNGVSRGVETTLRSTPRGEHA